ncbi:STAS domain-containing protein [Enterovirga sp.]|jgi:rsbT co-antagonist protein RsbR|uniref:STAS domain-containing protein n=1 Tax=Enterovirga sp. TaxID=2026350 RepID=UPI0026313DCA|nr:STAS domain-containing protein [Enterovirga sp.]MDB5591571.1 Anti-sigma-factor antagonist [Enterovirga sp.]
MVTDSSDALLSVLAKEEPRILRSWLESLNAGDSPQTGRIRDAELRTQAQAMLQHLRDALGSGASDAKSEAFAPLRDMLGDISRSRALQGFTPAETAHFILAAKDPIVEALNGTGDPSLAARAWPISRLLDQLSLHTMEVFLASREEVIGRQGQEIAELSTPVVQLWDGILALPLIGTLDSSRTSVVMENLLQAIVDEEAEIAIIDITGVPTVDTLVAQHLLKTIAAARLMGADCIVSGIRPQIAQTMVHLGVELNVVSKATLADAFALALRRTGRAVVRAKAPAPTGEDRT